MHSYTDGTTSNYTNYEIRHQITWVINCPTTTYKPDLNYYNLKTQ